MSRTLTSRSAGMLAKAWHLATTPAGTGEYIAAAHELTCHCDGSSCDGGVTCSIDRRGLTMYELAYEVASQKGANFPAYVAAWLRHEIEMRSQASTRIGHNPLGVSR